MGKPETTEEIIDDESIIDNSEEIVSPDDLIEFTDKQKEDIGKYVDFSVKQLERFRNAKNVHEIEELMETAENEAEQLYKDIDLDSVFGGNHP